MELSNIVNLPVSPINVLKDRLNKAIGDKMIIIAGRCKAHFDGRIKSTLESGDRLLVIKKDLSIIMHGPEGVKPLNWQKPNAGPIHFSEKDSSLEMFTSRKKTGETLTVMFEQIFTSMLWHALDETEIEIYGDESDLVKYLVSHPELIEEGFKVVKTEFQTKVGPVDIKGRDSKGREVIIEVKKRNASPADAHQLKRYVEYFKDTEEKNIRAIMVAPDFPKNVQEYLEKSGMSIKKVPWSEICPVIQRPKSSKLEDFFGNKKEEKNT